MSSRSIFWILGLLLLAGCRPQPAHETTVEALTVPPGYLPGGVPASFELLARSVHADGEVEVLLYAFGEAETGERCVATTLVRKGRSGWRPQASGPLTCGVFDPDLEKVLLVYAGGESATKLATIFGAAPGGEMVDVHWADDLVQVSQVQDGYVLVTRQDRVRPRLVEIRDADGTTLHTQEMGQ